MDPAHWIALALGIAGLLLLFMAVLSASETAVINARRSRLAQMDASRRLRDAEALIEAPDQFQTSAHLAKSLCESLIYALAALIGLEIALTVPREIMPATMWELLVRAWPGILAGALLTYLAVTILAETLPKAAAARQPEKTLLRWVGFARVFTLAFTPIRWVTMRLARALALQDPSDAQLTSRAAHSEEEIKLLVEGSAEEGVLEEEEKEMIHSVFEFADKVARQVMVPRIDLTGVSVETRLEDVVRESMESGHSRLPVYEGTLDSIVGVVHVKDLLPHLMAQSRETPVRDLMRDPYFIPEGKRLGELLQEFRRSKSQMAVVVDEFGGTSGLVTVEDVLEEIVGEIEDEYDEEEHPGAEVSASGDETIVDARMTLDDVNEELHLELPHGDYETLGGFVFSLFGRPPEAGERVAWGNLEFVAEALDGLRLQKIRILNRPPEPVETEDGHG